MPIDIKKRYSINVQVGIYFRLFQVSDKYSGETLAAERQIDGTRSVLLLILHSGFNGLTGILPF